MSSLFTTAHQGGGKAMVSLPLYSRHLYTLDDGSIVEVEVKADVAALLVELEKGQEARDKAQKEREKTFTDLHIKPEDIRDRKRKGQPPNFAWLVGISAIWAGPDSLWLVDKNGKRLSCRLCGHIKVMPPIAGCLNPECLRTGLDSQVKLECKKPMQETYDRPAIAKAAKRRA